MLNNHTVVASIISAILVTPVVARATSLVASVVDFSVIMFQSLTHTLQLASVHLQHTLQRLTCTYPSTQRGLNLNSRFHYSLECTSTDLNCSSALACKTCTLLIFSSQLTLSIIQYSASPRSPTAENALQHARAVSSVLDSALQTTAVFKIAPHLTPALDFTQPAAAFV